MKGYYLRGVKPSYLFEIEPSQRRVIYETMLNPIHLNIICKLRRETVMKNSSHSNLQAKKMLLIPSPNVLSLKSYYVSYVMIKIGINTPNY